MAVSTVARVVKTVTVNATPERAFDVFTKRFGDWWPLASHHAGKAQPATAVLEPKVGGRWCEVGVDGTETMWGYVTTWEPPHRLILAWHLGADFSFDPDVASEVEVTFVTDGLRTTVTLEHRNLEVHGDGAADLRADVGGGGGWAAILEEFARTVG